MAQDRNLLLPEAPAHDLDELVEIGNELLERHRRSRNVAIERLARAALIPMHDREMSLERRVEVAEEAHLAHARTTVQHDQRGIGDVLAADHHPSCRFSARSRKPGVGVWLFFSSLRIAHAGKYVAQTAHVTWIL